MNAKICTNKIKTKLCFKYFSCFEIYKSYHIYDSSFDPEVLSAMCSIYVSIKEDWEEIYNIQVFLLAERWCLIETRWRSDHTVLLQYLQVLLRCSANWVQLPSGRSHRWHTGRGNIQLCCGWGPKTDHSYIYMQVLVHKRQCHCAFVISLVSQRSPLFNSFVMLLSNSLCIWKKRKL